MCPLMGEDTEKLIDKAKNGDKSAFGIIYKEYYQRIYRYCRINLYSKVAAEDVCQDVFIKAWKALPGFTLKNGGTLQAFLFRIARNLIIDISRKKKEVSIDEALEIPTDEDLIEDLSKKTEIEQVKKAFEKLEDRDRQIIFLRYFEDLSHSEVAKIIGIREGALRVRTIRLLKKLKTIIEI